MANRIDLDKKATDYLKDKIGGGGQGGSTTKTYQYMFNSNDGYKHIFTFTSSDFEAPTENITFENTIGAFIGTSNRKVPGVITDLGSSSSSVCTPTFAFYSENNQEIESLDTDHHSAGASTFEFVLEDSSIW